MTARTYTPADVDVVVLGAGAAGLMCAIEAARRGRRVVVLDHAEKPAEKIRISGGGRCNFTHLDAKPTNFLSQNSRFCVSALSRFTSRDFLDRVEAAGIAWEEKAPGQLFCRTSARAIIDMLLGQLREAGGELRLGASITSVERAVGGFRVAGSAGDLTCASLVTATGGLSIPKMGATGFAYELARRFGLAVVDPRPGLVPFTFAGAQLEAMARLSGLSASARVHALEGGPSFEDGFMFTHRGLSGPSVLQVSSFWRGGEIAIDLAPGLDVGAELKAMRRTNGRTTLANALSQGLLPKRLAADVATRALGVADDGSADGLDASPRLADLSDAKLTAVADATQRWRVRPAGTEGWRTAEVTVGGVDTTELSSRTMEARKVAGLYFIGECVDVTGWLGGYNFQWAWSSGWAAGQVC